jgi:hypothetical protein
MKILFTALSVAAVSLLMGTLPLAAAAHVESSIGDMILPLNFEATSTAGDSWRGFPGRCEEGDGQFSGTFKSPTAEVLNLTGEIKKTGNSWSATLQWKSESEAEIPQAFLMMVYRISREQFETGKITSGSKEISLEKKFSEVPTNSHMVKVTDFTLIPSEGANLEFSFESPIDIEVIPLGNNLGLRIFITSPKSDLPSVGSLNWKITQG